MKKFYNNLKDKVTKILNNKKETTLDKVFENNITVSDTLTNIDSSTNIINNKPRFVTSEDLFKMDKDNDTKTQIDCCECPFFKKYKKACNMKNQNSTLCKFIHIIDYDEKKPTIVILDDNEGVVSFLLDDVKEILLSMGINNIYEKFNVLTFSSQYCAFNLISTINAYDIKNIDYGIFDITLGGGVFEENKGNIVLDGIDAFQACYEINSDMKYLFFTGNKLNPYIKKNKEIIEKFTKITNGKDLHDYILYKTSKTLEDRRQYLHRYYLRDFLNKENDL